MFWFFGCEARGISAPRPGIEPVPPALEGEVLTTGPPGKSWYILNYHPNSWYSHTVFKNKKCKKGISKNVLLLGINPHLPSSISFPQGTTVIHFLNVLPGFLYAYSSKYVYSDFPPFVI